MAVTTRQITSNVLGLIGAVVGGVLGYYTFQWIFYHGFYGMMIPGAFVGLGCGLLAQHPSHSPRGVLRYGRSGPGSLHGMELLPIQR